MKQSPSDEIRLRFSISILQRLGSLLHDGYSREDCAERIDKLVRTFNVAMYQRVIESRKTGLFADTVWFNIDLGTEVVRVVVRVSPTDDYNVTMDLAHSDCTKVLPHINN